MSGEKMHCTDHTELLVGLASLATKATYITAALSVNAALLLCIFSALLVNSATYGTITSQIQTIKADVAELQLLTQDHSAIVAKQQEVFRRLERVEARH